MSLDALKDDPQVADLFSRIQADLIYVRAIGVREPASLGGDFDTLLAAVVAAHDRKYADLLARWTAWREARMLRNAEPTRQAENDLYDAEAALAAWNRRSA